VAEVLYELNMYVYITCVFMELYKIIDIVTCSSDYERGPLVSVLLHSILILLVLSPLILPLLYSCGTDHAAQKTPLPLLL
jgi:hypothetical protein